jgi:hypothetical protein
VNYNYPLDKFTSFIQQKQYLLEAESGPFLRALNEVVIDYPQENQLLSKALDFSLPQMLKAEAIGHTAEQP